MNLMMKAALLAALAYAPAVAVHPDIDGGRDLRKRAEARDRRKREAEARRAERQKISAENAGWQLRRAAEKRARKAKKRARILAPNAEAHRKTGHD